MLTVTIGTLVQRIRILAVMRNDEEPGVRVKWAAAGSGARDDEEKRAEMAAPASPERHQLCYADREARSTVHRWAKRARLRGQGFRVSHVHDQNRVLTFHRWVEGEGHDVIVVLHLANFPRVGYRLGFPGGGDWREIFNSDVYEHWVNPSVVGNGGGVIAGPQPLHGFNYSAAVVLPANSVIVFAR